MRSMPSAVAQIGGCRRPLDADDRGSARRSPRPPPRSSRPPHREHRRPRRGAGSDGRIDAVHRSSTRRGDDPGCGSLATDSWPRKQPRSRRSWHRAPLRRQGALVEIPAIRGCPWRIRHTSRHFFSLGEVGGQQALAFPGGGLPGRDPTMSSPTQDRWLQVDPPTTAAWPTSPKTESCWVRSRRVTSDDST